MLFTASILALIALVAMFVFYYRHKILSLFPSSSPIHSGYSRLATFSSQAANGLTSRNFDLEENNLEAGDSRSGLDEAGAREVHVIMQQQGVSFDEARLIRHKRILQQNGIDPQTGMPLDSKAITRL